METKELDLVQLIRQLRDYVILDRKDYEKLTELLTKRNLTITTMESATSGQIASLLTDTEGASAILQGIVIRFIMMMHLHVR